MPASFATQYTKEAEACQGGAPDHLKERSYVAVKQPNRFLILFFVLLSIHDRSQAYQTVSDSLRELHRQIEILTQEIEQLKLGEVAAPTYEPQYGLGPAAAKIYSLKKTGVSLAGYGEVVYENFYKKRDDGATTTATDKIDYLRNVVYVGFRFNDWIVFNSEIEFEHASTGKGGEVSVEFGYIDLMLSREFNIRAGMVLPPVGIINEKHEPSTFFGTLRPQVERLIIPSTWRANGIGLYGEIVPDVQYRAYVVEGLNAARFSDSEGIRGGRQNGANAIAENLGVTGKLEYTGFTGSTIGASFYAGNSGQGKTDTSVATTLFSVHGDLNWMNVEMRALFAQVDIGEAAKASVLSGKTIGSSTKGWYVVAGYDVMPLILPGSQHYIAPFVQYERFNTHEAVPAGYTANKAYDRTILTIGLTYKPHPHVAFKVDYRDNGNSATTGVNQWNAAVNYLF